MTDTWFVYINPTSTGIRDLPRCQKILPQKTQLIHLLSKHNIRTERNSCFNYFLDLPQSLFATIKALPPPSLALLRVLSFLDGDGIQQSILYRDADNVMPEEADNIVMPDYPKCKEAGHAAVKELLQISFVSHGTNAALGRYAFEACVRYLVLS